MVFFSSHFRGFSGYGITKVFCIGERASWASELFISVPLT